MGEIQAIIAAANEAYARFTAAGPDPDVRVAVSNAVKFLAADLTSAAHLAASTSEKGN